MTEQEKAASVASRAPFCERQVAHTCVCTEVCWYDRVKQPTVSSTSH